MNKKKCEEEIKKYNEKIIELSKEIEVIENKINTKGKQLESLGIFSLNYK